MKPQVNIEDHLALVRRLASRLARKLPPSIDYDDLFQEGVIGLIQAARRYDPTINDSFRNYARRRIEGAMLDSVRRRHWIAATALDLSEATRSLIGESREAAVLNREEIEVLQRIKRKLTGRKQVLLRLIYAQEVTPRRAAAIMALNLPEFEALHRQTLDVLRLKMAKKATA